MPATISYAGLTDIGRVRKTNEDAFSIDPAIGLMVVADGLGGHQAGDVAATFVVTRLYRQLALSRAAGMGGAEQVLRQSLLMIAEQVFDMGCATPEYNGMGATVVAGLVADAKLVIASLGDSRAYRLRNGILEQLTHDHILGNVLRNNGTIQKDAEDLPEYHTLRAFLGMDTPSPPDIATCDLCERDRFLLCSDGLTNMLDDSAVGDILLCEPSPDDVCSQLVMRANQAGGYDNITVIIADVRSTDSPKQAGKDVEQELAEMDVQAMPWANTASETDRHSPE